MQPTSKLLGVISDFIYSSFSLINFWEEKLKYQYGENQI